MNPRLKTYVYAYMFRRNADNVWHETGQLCKGWRQSKKKWADLSAFPKIDMGLWQNADFDSKPCVLQHFGSPPFNSITSKYCKGYKFHKKEDFKMLKNRGVAPGPVTLFVCLFVLVFLCWLPSPRLESQQMWSQRVEDHERKQKNVILDSLEKTEHGGVSLWRISGFFGATNSRHEQTLWSTKPKGFSPNPKVNVFAVRQCCNKRFLTSKTPDSPGWHEALHWPIFFCQFSGQKWNAQLIAGNPNVAQKISQDGWVTFLESSGNQQSCGTWPLFYTVHRQLKESGKLLFSRSLVATGFAPLQEICLQIRIFSFKSKSRVTPLD